MTPSWPRGTPFALALALAAAPTACDSPTPTGPTPVVEPEAPGPTAEEADIAAARPTVDVWLDLIDAGRYRRAWALGSSYFKSVVTAEELVRAMNAHRAPLGAVDHRAFRSATRTDDLPGAPVAPYAVFSFRTVFADGAVVVETITAEREGDSWLIAGHILTPVG